MVKVIMGKKGSGKTKQIIDLVNVAVNEEAGSVVCVENGQTLRMNIKYSAKLVDISEYSMELGYDYLYAFVCGLLQQLRYHSRLYRRPVQGHR